MKNMFSNKTKLSIPDEKTLYGINIKKLPIGQYIKTTELLKDLPQILLKDVFPGADIDKLVDKFKNMDEQFLFEITGKLLTVVPDQFLKVVSSLLDCEYEYLRDNITPNELLEIILAMWEVNDMSNFFKNLKKMGMMLTK